MGRQGMLDSERPGMVNPMRLIWELNDAIADNTMVAADSGSSANWYARHLRMRGNMRGSRSGNLAAMGPASPTPWAPSSLTRTAPRWPSSVTAPCK